MDYQKLAQLLYPNITKDVQYYFNKYSKRKLPSGAEVTRFAPSPTGHLHFGGLYQSVIDSMLAHKSGGVFYLRLEDTDQKRKIDEAGSIVYYCLSLFGLTPDEGYRGDHMAEVGEYGPYVQSNRMEIYQCFAKHLVARGRAFPCFCDKAESKDDVLKRREEDLEATDTITEHDACRTLTYDEIEANIKAGKKWALRLLSHGDINKTIDVFDCIKGKRTLRQNAKDIVIMKSNGIPPYAFAHLVDDTLMGTTTVVRGEEWFQSVTAHIELFEAMGLTPPKYAHTPVICKLDNGNKRKLSKRKDSEADARYYLQKGYPAQAVIEYLVNLANSDFEIWRKNNPDKDVTEFDFKISKMGSNNPMFDFDKLNDYSKNIISRMTADQVYNYVLEWAKTYNATFADYLEHNKDYAINVFDIDRGGAKPRKDIIYWSQVPEYYDYMFENYTKLNVSFEMFPKVPSELICKILDKYTDTFNANDDKNIWFDKVKAIASELGFCTNNAEYKTNPDKYYGNVADICGIIRVAFTGKVNTPDLFSICKVLGTDELQARVNYLKTII